MLRLYKPVFERIITLVTERRRYHLVSVIWMIACVGGERYRGYSTGYESHIG